MRCAFRFFGGSVGFLHPASACGSARAQGRTPAVAARAQVQLRDRGLEEVQGQVALLREEEQVPRSARQHLAEIIVSLLTLYSVIKTLLALYSVI